MEAKLHTISRALLSSSRLSEDDEKQIQEGWKAIRKKLTKCNSFRNKLAHGVLTNRGTEDGLFIYWDPFPWENNIPIMPSAMRALAKGEQPKFEISPPGAIALEEITDFQKTLAGMYREVTGFSKRVHARRVLASGR